MTKIVQRPMEVSRMPEAPQLSEVPRLPTASYIPGGTTDPVRLAGITVKAVDQIGDVAAKKIEETADAFEAEAKIIGDKLRKLASAMREHTVIANAHVSEFGEKANSVVDLIRDLDAKLNGGDPVDTPASGDDGAPIPKFLEQGPTVNGAARN